MVRTAVIIAEPAVAGARVAGLSVVERWARQARRAGIVELRVLGPAAAGLEGRTRSTTAPGDGLMPDLAEPVLLIHGGGICQGPVLERLVAQEPTPDAAVLATSSCVGASPSSAIQVRLKQGQVEAIGQEVEGADGVSLGVVLCPPELARELLEAPGTGFVSGLARLAARGQLRAAVLQEVCWLPVTDESARQAAEQRLLRSGIKPTDSLLARHLDRHLSLAITRRLLPTAVTPNQVTLVSLTVGLLGSLAFVPGAHGADVAGAALLLVSSVLDGCDGELARLRLEESRLGGWLDLVGDNAVHVALFVGIGVGAYHRSGAPAQLLLGGIAGLGVLLSFATVWYFRLRRRRGPGPLFTSVAPGKGRAGALALVTRLDNALGNRDFLYLLLLLALLDRLGWILWAGAVGANLFFLSLLLVNMAARNGGERGPRAASGARP